ncbi:MAG: radical SAM protein [Actinomycetales bacterium]
MTAMRWQVADQAEDPQPALFGVRDVVGVDEGSARLSGLELIPVTARRILNQVPPTSAMPFRWTINAYRGCSHACTYCFARPTHEYLGLDAGADFDRKIVVKINAVERLRAELADPHWRHEHVAMGTNTDPYQRAEGRFRLTRGIIGELARSGTPFSILTKSAMVTRDLDVLQAASRSVPVKVTFSVGTVDETVWRATEPGTPHPARRLDAMKALARAGIPTGVLLAPVLPGLSGGRPQLRATVAAVRQAGGYVVGSRTLYLRGATRDHFLTWLQGYDPQLHARYLKAFRGRTEMPKEYDAWVRSVIAEAQA